MNDPNIKNTNTSGQDETFYELLQIVCYAVKKVQEEILTEKE